MFYNLYLQYKAWSRTQKQMRGGMMLTKCWTGNYKTEWINIQKAVYTQVGRQEEEAEAQETDNLTT